MQQVLTSLCSRLLLVPRVSPVPGAKANRAVSGLRAFLCADRLPRCLMGGFPLLLQTRRRARCPQRLACVDHQWAALSPPPFTRAPAGWHTVLSLGPGSRPLPCSSGLGAPRAPRAPCCPQVSLHGALAFVNSPSLSSPWMAPVIRFLPGPRLQRSPPSSPPPCTYSRRCSDGRPPPPRAPLPGAGGLRVAHVPGALLHALCSPHCPASTPSSSRTGSGPGSVLPPETTRCGAAVGVGRVRQVFLRMIN